MRLSASKRGSVASAVARLLFFAVIAAYTTSAASYDVFHNSVDDWLIASQQNRALTQVSGVLSCTVLLWTGTSLVGTQYKWTSTEWQQGSALRCNSQSLVGTVLLDAAQSVSLTCQCRVLDATTNTCWPVASSAVLSLTDTSASADPTTSSIVVAFTSALCQTTQCALSLPNLSQVAAVVNGVTTTINMTGRIDSFQLCLGSAAGPPPQSAPPPPPPSLSFPSQPLPPPAKRPSPPPLPATRTPVGTYPPPPPPSDDDYVIFVPMDLPPSPPKFPPSVRPPPPSPVRPPPQIRSPPPPPPTATRLASPPPTVNVSSTPPPPIVNVSSTPPPPTLNTPPPPIVNVSSTPPPSPVNVTSTPPPPTLKASPSPAPTPPPSLLGLLPSPVLLVSHSPPPPPPLIMAPPPRVPEPPPPTAPPASLAAAPPPANVTTSPVTQELSPASAAYPPPTSPPSLLLPLKPPPPLSPPPPATPPPLPIAAHPLPPPPPLVATAQPPSPPRVAVVLQGAPPPSPPTARSSGVVCPDAGIALTLMNVRRLQHGTPLLSWDPSLVSTSATWAATLAWSDTCTGALSASASAGNVGETIFTWAGDAVANATCTTAASTWYDEGASLYVYSSKPYTNNLPVLDLVRDFAQMLWRNTTQVGCGFATGKTPSGVPCAVSVCQYLVPGLTQSDTDWLANVAPLQTSRRSLRGARVRRRVRRASCRQ